MGVESGCACFHFIHFVGCGDEEYVFYDLTSVGDGSDLCHFKVFCKSQFAVSNSGTGPSGPNVGLHQ